MAFSTSSFFAGVGTVVAAVTIGFAVGAMIPTSPKMEPNRLERVAAGAPVPASATKVAATAAAPAPAAKAETPAVASVPEAAMANNVTQENTASPDRVVSTPASVQVIPPQPLQVVAREEDRASQIDNAKKIREGELRKRAEIDRRAEQQHRDSRKRREIDAAVNAVRQMRRDGVLEEARQDDMPQFGFFGRN